MALDLFVFILFLDGFPGDEKFWAEPMNDPFFSFPTMLMFPHFDFAFQVEALKFCFNGFSLVLVLALFGCEEVMDR